VPLRCPIFQELIDFQDGRLDREKARLVERHLATGCPRCTADQSWYERLRSAAQSGDRFTPPGWARNRAILLFEERREKAALGDPNLFDIALMDYDSESGRPSAGARSSELAERQLVYQAPGFTIDLQIGPAEDTGAEVLGQILHESERGFASVTGLLVDLLNFEESVWTTVTSAVGEFRMVGVDFGEYELMIDTREKQIRIPFLPILL
jgi:hypothetical protein